MWPSPGSQVNPKAQVDKDVGAVPKLCIGSHFSLNRRELTLCICGETGRSHRINLLKVPGLTGSRPKARLKAQSRAWTSQRGLLLRAWLSLGVIVLQASHLLLGNLIWGSQLWKQEDGDRGTS